jgi:hypothetical protein
LETLPELIHRGLDARDRLKYYVSLLRAADVFAQSPHFPAPTLRAEREASGISDEMFDEIVAGSRTVAQDLVSIPGSSVILKHIFADLQQMLMPLSAAVITHPEMRERLEVYQRRVNQQIAIAPPCFDDRLTSKMIAGLAQGRANGHDSVQLLASDLQRELIQLIGILPPESVEGVS